MVPSSCLLSHVLDFSRKLWKGPCSWIVCFSSDKCAAQFFFYLLKIYDFPMGICQKEGQPIFMFHLPLRICQPRLLLLRINLHLNAFVQLLLDQLLLLYPPNIWPKCFPLDLWAVFSHDPNTMHPVGLKMVWDAFLAPCFGGKVPQNWNLGSKI